MLRKILKILVFITIMCIMVVTIINVYIIQSTNNFILTHPSDIPDKYTCIVLGAFVNKDGQPSTVLSNRLEASLELYRSGKTKRFLLTGDHGHTKYDEVNNMKKYLINKEVPEHDIFLDHAGFDTYNSMVRAKEIFEVQGTIIVTQQFHLNRALYIARKKGLDAYGFEAPMTHKKALAYLHFRESIARVKAFWEVLINKKPRFLGTKIPITGDSKLSYD